MLSSRTMTASPIKRCSLIFPLDYEPDLVAYSWQIPPLWRGRCSLARRDELKTGQVKSGAQGVTFQVGKPPKVRSSTGIHHFCLTGPHIGTLTLGTQLCHGVKTLEPALGEATRRGPHAEKLRPQPASATPRHVNEEPAGHSAPARLLT